MTDLVNKGRILALIKCGECGNEVSSKAQACPKCGAKVVAKSSFSIIKLIGLLFFGGIVYIVAIADKPSVAATQSLSVASVQGLEAVEVAFKRAQLGNLVVSGTVSNTTGKKYGYVQVEINLFDKKGVQVGSTLTNVNNLEAGAVWAFEAPVLDERARSAKVAGITAY